MGRTIKEKEREVQVLNWRGYCPLLKLGRDRLGLARALGGAG